MNTKAGTWRCMPEWQRAYWRTVLDAETVRELDSAL